MQDIFDFLYQWHDVTPEQAAIPADQVPTYLPEPLRELHMRFGKLIKRPDSHKYGPFSTQNTLFSPKAMTVETELLSECLSESEAWGEREWEEIQAALALPPQQLLELVKDSNCQVELCIAAENQGVWAGYIDITQQPARFVLTKEGDPYPADLAAFLTVLCLDEAQYWRQTGWHEWTYQLVEQTKDIPTLKRHLKNGDAVRTLWDHDQTETDTLGKIRPSFHYDPVSQTLIKVEKVAERPDYASLYFSSKGTTDIADILKDPAALGFDNEEHFSNRPPHPRWW